VAKEDEANVSVDFMRLLDEVGLVVCHGPIFIVRIAIIASMSKDLYAIFSPAGIQR